MAVREHAAFLTKHNSKCADDAYIHFGTKAGYKDFATYDRRLGYNSTDRQLNLDMVRGDAATNQYETGLYINASDLFVQTGARKSWAVQIMGTRTSAVMGGDANDMILRLGHTNYAVNTPAGSYSRGLDISVQNRGGGTITAIQGGFISARQRGDGGAISTVRGLAIDTVLNVGAAVPDTLIEGLHIEQQLEANCPAAGNETGGYGVIVIQRTDGVYSVAPVAAYAARNRGTSSCKGYIYGLDLYDSRARTALCEIRLASADSDAVPGLILSGAATDDAGIAADLAARGITAAHGSVYISVVKTGGLIFQNRNGTWTAF